MQEITIRKDISKPIATETERTAYLICGYISKTISARESVELQQWVAQNLYNQLLFAEMILPYNIKAIFNR